MTDPSYKSTSTTGGFGNRIGWGSRPALLLIDVCTAYFTPGSPLDISSNSASAASPAVMRRLLSTARAARVPVIWTKVEYKADMSDAGLFYSKAKQLDVWRHGDERGLAAWVDGLVPETEEEVIAKKHASAFFGTELVSKLTLLGVDTLVVCGVSTSGCVRATAVDALSYNYRPMVVGTACGDRIGIHEANLHDIDAKMADVVTEEDALEHLKVGWS